MAGHGHSVNCTELFPPDAPKTGDIIKKVSKAKTTSSLFQAKHLKFLHFYSDLP